MAWRAGLFLAATLALTAGAGAGTTRHPLSEKAEASFFQTFNVDSKGQAATQRDLLTALYTDPKDGRTWLLLGLDHLWLAAEGDRTNPVAIEHLMLAERYLSRAQALNPSDRRIPSWLVPARLSLAGIEGNEERKKEIQRDLLAAWKKDPAFHSFSVALLGANEERTSPEFQRGLEALHGADAGCANNPAVCQDRPHWPHNREGFLTFTADYELKAGHKDRARELLAKVQNEPGYASWPFQGEVQDRLDHLDEYAALYADADRGNDPPHLMSLSGGMMCRSCHQGP
jgi:hypothetical protein